MGRGTFIRRGSRRVVVCTSAASLSPCGTRGMFSSGFMLRFSIWHKSDHRFTDLHQLGELWEPPDNTLEVTLKGSHQSWLCLPAWPLKATSSHRDTHRDYELIWQVNFKLLIHTLQAGLCVAVICKKYNSGLLKWIWFHQGQFTVNGLFWPLSMSQEHYNMTYLWSIPSHT